MTKARKYIANTFLIVGLLLVVCTLISLLYSTSYWFIQVFNFPRLQALVALTVCLLVYLGLQKDTVKWFVVAIAAAIAVNVGYLLPYAPFYTELVKSSEANSNNNNRFSIMLANVFMKNRNADALLAIVQKQNPGMLLTMEVDSWWTNALQPLQKDYPYKMLFPTGNTYGMALYSKLPLSDTRQLFFNHDSVPSFSAVVKLPGGKSFRLLTVHPVAPKSSKHPDNVNNKEVGLIEAGKYIANFSDPRIVAGDFNDVGWSPNTSRFEKLSGLKDVRYGRGLYNTFNAENLLMRWPLDYVYASSQFRVVNIQRLSKFGSDHFPFLATLELAE